MQTIKTISQAKKRRNKISKIAWSIFGILLAFLMVTSFFLGNEKINRFLALLIIGYSIIASIIVHILFNDNIRSWAELTDVDGMGSKYNIKAAYQKLQWLNKTELALSLNESLELKKEQQVKVYRAITSLKEMGMKISDEDLVLITLEKKLKKLERI